MRSLLLVTLGSLVVSSAAANGILTLGTPDAPEILDAPGDVAYSPLHVGARDHDYLDFLKAWIEHDNTTDKITLTMTNQDATKLKSASGTWQIACNVAGDLKSEGETVGRLRFSWGQSNTDPQIRSSVHTQTDPADTAEQRTLDHQFESRLESPGVFRFKVDRVALLLYGDVLENPSGRCLEIFTTAQSSTGTILNEDLAPSQSAYSFSELRRLRAPDGAMDPIEKFERENASVIPSSSTLGSEDQTPGASVTTGLLAMGALTIFRRYRGQE